MDRIEAVTFDLDDTLIQYRRSPGELLRTSFERLGVDPLFAVEEYYARYDEFAESCDSVDELRADCFAELAAENGFDREIGREVAASFSEERDQSNVEFLQGAGRVLDVIRRQYPVAVVTNGAADAQLEKCEAVALDQWVEKIVVAGHETPPKPAPDAFERALQSLDVVPDRAIHIGDSLDTDVAGASAAGLDSVWIGDGSTVTLEPTYQVETIEDILSLPWVRDGSAGER